MANILDFYKFKYNIVFTNNYHNYSIKLFNFNYRRYILFLFICLSIVAIYSTQLKHNFVQLKAYPSLQNKLKFFIKSISQLQLPFI